MFWFALQLVLFFFFYYLLFSLFWLLFTLLSLFRLLWIIFNHIFYFFYTFLLPVWFSVVFCFCFFSFFVWLLFIFLAVFPLLCINVFIHVYLSLFFYFYLFFHYFVFYFFCLSLNWHLVSCFLFCVLLSFVLINDSILLHLLAGSLCTLFSLMLGFCVYSFILFLLVWFCFYHLWVSLCFLLLFACFNPLYYHIKTACGTHFLRSKGLSLTCWVQGLLCVQGSRPSENSWPLGILISQNSQRSPLNSTSSTNQVPAASSAGCFAHIANKTEHKRSDSRQVKDTHIITSHDLSHQRESSPPPTRIQAQVPSNTKLIEATDQPYPLEAETKSKKNCDPIAWGMETTNTVS